MQPSEIKVQQGGNWLVPSLIREKSPVRRVYASCCDTPMFDIGGAAAMLNTDLLELETRPPVKFRIIGRDAQKAVSSSNEKKPAISWSLPLAWLWTMPGRIQKEKMEPTPIDISKPKILENFKQG